MVMEDLYACSQVENSSTKKNPWTRIKNQTGPKKKEIVSHLCIGKKIVFLKAAKAYGIPY